MKATKKYNIIGRLSLAKFWYQGQSHTHPVRREVILTGNSRTHLVGYEVRVGRDTTPVDVAPIKSYRKDKIARYGQFCRIRESKKNQDKDMTASTLVRRPLIEYFNQT